MKCFVLFLLLISLCETTVEPNDLQNILERLKYLEKRDVHYRQLEETVDSLSRNLNLLTNELNAVKQRCDQRSNNAVNTLDLSPVASRTKVSAPDFQHPVGLDHVETTNPLSNHINKLIPPRYNHINTSQSILKRATQREAANRVAFAAHSSTTRKNIGSEQTLVFDQVTLNEGSGYHGPTGIFTCPNPGVYVFLWTVLPEPGHVVDVRLVKNGVDIAGSVADGSHGHFASASNSGIFEAQHGDQVWIKTIRLAAGSTTSLQAYHSAFRGFLLY